MSGHLISARAIARAHAAVHGVSEAALFGRARVASVARVRHEAMWLARRLLGRTIGQLGRSFRRDHTTVSHALARIEASRAADPAYTARLDRLLSSLQDGLARSAAPSLPRAAGEGRGGGASTRESYP